MAEYKGKNMPETADRECDIRVWDDSCKRSEYASQSEKYLCPACGKIPVLHHEVHHEHFPHICGDEDEMS